MYRARGVEIIVRDSKAANCAFGSEADICIFEYALKVVCRKHIHDQAILPGQHWVT
jgi:hypothetical protein